MNRVTDNAAVKAMLLAQSAAVCRHLFPHGRRYSNEWRCGNLTGDTGTSLSINLATGVWADFATGEKGSNLLELWLQAKKLSFADALAEAMAFCGLTILGTDREDEKSALRKNWPDLRLGNKDELQAVATLRGIALEGILLASDRGFLKFAHYDGHLCFVVTDSRRINAQARRLDGKPFMRQGRAIKALTLPGSVATWPLGLAETQNYPCVVIVEGGPDFLAAHGCMFVEDRTDTAAVAVLGAMHRPPLSVWAALAHKRVRVFCHSDDAGMKAAHDWAQAIDRAAATVDGFQFKGLRKIDLSPVKDLNDLLHLHYEDFEERRDVWEVLPEVLL